MKPLTQFMLVSFFATGPLIAGKLPLTDDEKTWLKSVELIITPDERKFYKKKCSTHIERREFMDLFWAKRDPDLTDSVNPFKDEYFARMDYVATHYREFEGRPPRTDRGYVYMLLGKPDRVEYRADPLLVGFNYRNPYPQFPAELWIYNELDFGTARRRAVVQMLPKNSFGDYVALVDAQLDRLLRRIKYDFIVNPDLEKAPVQSVQVTDLQPEPADQTLEQSQPQTQIEGSQPPPAETTALPVPAITNSGKISSAVFDTDAGNDMGLAAASAQFYNASGKNLVIVRFGFPLEQLNFIGEKDVEASFSLKYAILGADGRQITNDTIRQQLVFPNHAAVKRQDRYSQEITKLLEPGRYQLQLQLESQGRPASFWQDTLTVAPVPAGEPALTPLVLMDPDTNPDSANFKLEGRAFTPRLDPTYVQGEPIYPVFEFIHPQQTAILDSIRILMLKNGSVIKNWNLYPEEMTSLGSGATICHPEISSKKIKEGDYQLRAEIELPNHDILISETAIKIVKE